MKLTILAAMVGAAAAFAPANTVRYNAENGSVIRFKECNQPFSEEIGNRCTM
jgi:hypothetical protein